jgi:hypothetical protein
MVASQGWRFASEFMRSDFRGQGHITIYQWMALVTALVATLYAFIFDSSPGLAKLPIFDLGMRGLWSAGPLLIIQILGVYIFVVTGRSSVTRSKMSMHLVTEA